MRLNKYTLVIEDEGNTILYNLITKTLIQIACRKEDIQTEFIEQLEMEEIEYYKERLLISEDDNDDVEEMLVIKNQFNNQSDIGRFMIHLGYACNLKCSYCYQSVICDEARKEVIDCERIISFVKQAAIINAFDEYDVCFIGGEPLIYWKEMLKISKALNTLLPENKIYYSVVTNGTLLNDEHGLAELIKEGIVDYQITIDGTKEFHDQYRRNGNRGSFDEIISNIKSAVNTFHDIKISINCNLSKQNSQSVPDFFEFLKEEGMSIPISFSMIFDNGKNIPLEYHSHNVIWRDAHITAIKYGQDYDPFYRDLYLGCALTQKNYFIVGSDGKLYKCINAIDNRDYLISDIDKYASDEYRRNILKFLNYQPNNQNCEICELYPICYGGCEYRNKLAGFVCEKDMFYANEIPIIKEIVHAKTM